MKTLRFTILFLLIFTFHSINSQNIPEKYLITAAENNPELKSNFNDYLAVLERTNQVRTLPDPQIAFAYFIQPVETRNGPQNMKFSVSQMFPWFGKLKADENSMLWIAKAKYELFEEAKAKLFFKVSNNYYQLYYLKNAIDISKENLKILETFKQLTRIKTEVGKGSSVDLFRIELDIEELNEKINSLQDNLSEISVAFNLLLNVPEYTSIEISDKIDVLEIAYSKEQALDSILQNSHRLISIDNRVESLVFKEKSIKKSNYPSFSVGFDYLSIGSSEFDVPSSGKDAFVFPRVGLSIPLYGKKNKSKIKEVELMRESSSYLKESTINNLKTELESAWINYSGYVRKIELYEKQKETAQKALNILEVEFQTDSKDFEEVLRMQRKLLDYSIKLYEAKTGLLKSVALINYLIGN